MFTIIAAAVQPDTPTDNAIPEPMPETRYEMRSHGHDGQHQSLALDGLKTW